MLYYVFYVMLCVLCYVCYVCSCRHILAAHLAHDPEPGWAMQSLAQQASHFLLAVSIRSAEGRRRIVSCIVDGLTGRPPLDQQPPLEGPPPKPPLYKVVCFPAVLCCG